MRGGIAKAVNGVSFAVQKGETLGIAGESGSGKTTVALSLMRLIEPPGKIVNGSIEFDGQDVLGMNDEQLREFRWKRISMVMQGAMSSLDPLYKIGDQIIEAIRYHEKAARSEAWSRAERLLEQVGIEKSRSRGYPHEFSGGMKQRAMIAMALALNPELVIADEPTTALDVVIQAQIINLLRDLQKKLKISIILISHDLSLLAEFSDRIAIMYAGRLVEISDKKNIIKSSLHPYTSALISSIPTLKGKKERLKSISGNPPNLMNVPSGCPFHPRCPLVTDICRLEEPSLIEKRKAQFVACHNVN